MNTAIKARILATQLLRQAEMAETLADASSTLEDLSRALQDDDGEIAGRMRDAIRAVETVLGVANEAIPRVIDAARDLLELVEGDDEEAGA